MNRETGFPSPAQGYEVKNIDLNDEIIKNPESTYLMRLETDIMEWRGVFSQTILVVDRSRTPVKGDLVVAILDGVFVCREYTEKRQKKGLFDGNSTVYPSAENYIFGVVTTAINKFY